jgi:hypothetical protein
MTRFTAALAATSLCALATAHAAEVTPSGELLFGDGNENEAFTVTTTEAGGTTIEIGLRGKLRFDENGAPQSVYNWDGTDTYSFNPSSSTPGFGFTTGADPTWNFDWSVNVDQAGTSGAALDDFTYRFEWDTDPSAGETFVSYEPINVLCADHATGTNGSTNATANVVPISDCRNAATAANAEAEYQSNIAIDNVAQNSWSYAFFQPLLADFDPTDAGIYTIKLSVFANSQSDVALASNSIKIAVSNGEVPLPGAVVFMAAGLAGLGGIRRMQSKKG